MSGIHGIYRFDGLSVEPGILAAMGERTRHRGPDDEGSHLDGPCGIAIRRLSIIDLAGGHQPVSNADGSLWLVCNGEIYNRRELRRELQDKGYRFNTGADCELLIHLYDAEGDEFIQRLNGMFGFALWDARRHRLLIGRDRLGVKPLYFLRDWQRLAFASEAKALLALPGISAELDREVLADYLHLGYVAAPGCIFKGIRKLPPATLLAVEAGQVREWRYWRLPDRCLPGVPESEWCDRVRAHLDDSVRGQMANDVPIGAFLSEGVDSSAVVGLMARHAEQPIRTYAIAVAGWQPEAVYRDLHQARRVAGLFATEHREILVRPDVVSLLPKLLWHMDEPLSDTAFITTFLVSECAREDVKVILSGVGGDELFGGYRRYLGGHHARRYRNLPGWLRNLASLAEAHLPANPRAGLFSRIGMAKRFIASAGMSADERYRSYLQVLDRQAVAALLTEPRGQASDPLSRAFAAAGSGDELNRMLAVDAETRLPNDLLLTDKMSMAVSLEWRMPFLDHQLVELAASIPASVKVRDGRLKSLLKLALANLLPDDILNRQNRGFGTPMGAWLKRELTPLLRHLLAPAIVEARGLFHASLLARLIADHEANRIDGTDVLLALLNLEIWSRIYLDRRDPADVTEELKIYMP